jgi:hypothetical protein
MKIFATFFAVLTLLAAHSLSAQPGPPVRVRGTVQSFDGHTLTIATATQGAVRLTVGDSTGINGVEKKSAADIGPNTFIGTTAVKDSRDRWRATEVHIFPESMRGAGEGHYAWDLPESTMTNAAVTGTAAKRRGRTLHLKYSTNQGSPTGGEVDVDVTKKTAIVALTAGDRSLLVPGAAVFALAAPGQGGTANAIAVVAETRGVKPPM